MKIVFINKTFTLHVYIIIGTRCKNDCFQLFRVPEVSLDIMAYGIWENEMSEFILKINAFKEMRFTYILFFIYL